MPRSAGTGGASAPPAEREGWLRLLAQSGAFSAMLRHIPAAAGRSMPFSRGEWRLIRVAARTGLRVWQLRWCVLRGRQLRCYVSPKDEKEDNINTVLDVARFNWVGPVARSLFETEALDGPDSPSTDIALSGPDGAAARIRASSSADSASWIAALKQQCASADADSAGSSPRSIRVASSPTLARASRIQDRVWHATSSMRRGHAQDGAAEPSPQEPGGSVDTGLPAAASTASGAKEMSDCEATPGLDAQHKGWLRRQSRVGACPRLPPGLVIPLTLSHRPPRVARTLRRAVQSLPPHRCL